MKVKLSPALVVDGAVWTKCKSDDCAVTVMLLVPVIVPWVAVSV